MPEAPRGLRRCLHNVFLGAVVHHAKAHLSALRHGMLSDGDGVEFRRQPGLRVNPQLGPGLWPAVLFGHGLTPRFIISTAGKIY